MIDRIGSTWTSRLAFGTGWAVLYLWLATEWWQFLFLPLHWMMGPTQGAIVNWCGHRYGYRNFATRDASRNFLPFDFLTMGELFQNNHHRASGRLNFAWRKFEFDPTYQVLRMLAWMRVIRLMPTEERAQPPPEPSAAQATGSISTPGVQDAGRVERALRGAQRAGEAVGPLPVVPGAVIAADGVVMRDRAAVPQDRVRRRGLDLRPLLELARPGVPAR